MDALKLIAQDSLKADVSEAIKVGNTIKIWVKIREGERERLQAFEGTVIAIKGSGVSQTFTVRRVSYGVGVERVFPVHSPNVDKIELIRTGKVRRSKLYYLRDRVGKAAKVKQSIGLCNLRLQKRAEGYGGGSMPFCFLERFLRFYRLSYKEVLQCY